MARRRLGSRIKAVVLTVAMTLSAVIVAPLPASAACDVDHLDFASGTALKFSLDSGYASAGTCSDVNMRYYKDGDGCNSESITHKGWYYDPSHAEWIPGYLGFVESDECVTYSDNPLLTSVVTGTEYDFQSTQSGGFAEGLD